MVDIPIEVDVSSASRSLADVGKSAEQGAKAAAKAVEKIADGYTKAAVSAERFRQTVMRAEKDAANRERTANGFRQGMAVDSRVSSANLSRGFRDSRIDALNLRRNARTEAGELPDIAGKVASGVEGIVSRFGAMTSAAAAAAIAVSALATAASLSAASQRERGENSRSFGDRVKANGKAGATLGLSQAQLGRFAKAGGKMTVSEQEAMLHSMGDAQAAKPFGMPRLAPDEIMALLSRSQSTGIDLSSVVANPAAAPGNSGILADMEVARRGGSLKSFDRDKNGKSTGPNIDVSYNRSTAPLADAEMRLQSIESNIADQPLKDSYKSGINERIGTDVRNARGNSGFWGKVANFFDGSQDAIPGNLGSQGGAARAGNDQLNQIASDISRQTTIMTKPPKPTVTRNGDQ